jgi:hypothetical protein
MGLVGAVACGSGTEEAETGEAAETATCGAEQQLAAFNRMLNAPLISDALDWRLDLANPDWTMATLADAEKTLCTIEPHRRCCERSGPRSARLGPSSEPCLDGRRRKNRAARSRAGRFRPVIAASSNSSRARRRSAIHEPNPFGQHTYTIALDGPILRDGSPWEIKWGTACTATATDCFERQATDCFDGMLETFAPELPSTQESCRADQSCLAKQFFAGEGLPKQGIFGARPLGLYFVVNDTSGTFGAPSFFYGFPVKTMPFCESGTSSFGSA